MNPDELPVRKESKTIIDALRDNQVIIIEAPTGSGKTTQVPQILLEAGITDLCIGVTQPRRIAAMSVAQRIGEELEQRTGWNHGVVGYKTRFVDTTTPFTRLKVMTDGILLQEAHFDPFLQSYGVIMVDEAHERSLNIDFTMGMLKHLLQERSDLRVLVSSATLRPEVFVEFFGQAPLVKIEARMFPVDVRYEIPKSDDLIETVVRKISDIPARLRGDVLVFLPGEASIKACLKALKNTFGDTIDALPLYARLPEEDQRRVFDPSDRMKVIVATNIAETSITIDGIKTVIDSGLVKINDFNPRTSITSLQERPHSKASADQRAGRAGRTSSGQCIRLYSRKDYADRLAFTVEEIFRSDLSEVVLRLLGLGVKEVESFPLPSPPERRSLKGALELLMELGAVDERRELTYRGYRMLDFPTSPRIGRMIIEAVDRFPHTLDDVLVVSSFLSIHSPFLFPPGEERQAKMVHRELRHPLGDFHTWLALYRAYEEAPDPEEHCRDHYLDRRVLDEAQNIHGQLRDILERRGTFPRPGGGKGSQLVRAMAAGLKGFILVRDPRTGNYRGPKVSGVQIHGGSSLIGQRPDIFVAGEIVVTDRPLARSGAVIKREWALEVEPELESFLHFQSRSPKTKKDQAQQGRRLRKRQKVYSI